MLVVQDNSVQFKQHNLTCKPHNFIILYGMIGLICEMGIFLMHYIHICSTEHLNSFWHLSCPATINATSFPHSQSLLYSSLPYTIELLHTSTQQTPLLLIKGHLSAGACLAPGLQKDTLQQGRAAQQSKLILDHHAPLKFHTA